MPDRVCKEVADVISAITVADDRSRGLERTEDDRRALRGVIELGNLVDVKPVPGDPPYTEADLAMVLAEVNAAIDLNKDGLFLPAVAEVHMSHPGCRNAVLVTFMMT